MTRRFVCGTGGPASASKCSLVMERSCAVFVSYRMDESCQVLKTTRSSSGTSHNNNNDDDDGSDEGDHFPNFRSIESFELFFVTVFPNLS